jgi:tetratricopeptide (TPR) repeat protein
MAAKQGTGIFAALAGYDRLAVSVNGFLAAGQSARSGNAEADQERQKHLRDMQFSYWDIVASMLTGVVARRRPNLEFSDDERLFIDLGLVDARILAAADRQKAVRELLDLLNDKGAPGCFYPSEWLGQRHQQLQIEYSIPGDEPQAASGTQSKLEEMRGRIIARMAPFFTGLPGVPLEISGAMRSGELDRGLIASGIAALREPNRKSYLRRHNLWTLRLQTLDKARSRAGTREALRFFELLDEVYVRDWREHYEKFLSEDSAAGPAEAADGPDSSPALNSEAEALTAETRRLRAHLILMDAIDDKDQPDVALHALGPLVGKRDLAAFLPVAQAFDRLLAEMPPIIIAPGSGRGFFVWESGCLILRLRPLVGLDDSVATALAWYRMLDDHFNHQGELRDAYAKRFPGAVFDVDFPADYRAWLCHAAKGDASAMNPQRRGFFRDFIGPDISGPLLPANLRNVGPQTMALICRRLERQVASGEEDVNLHRRLAAIYWHQGNAQAAGVQYTAAMRLAPDDGETLFAAGMFMRSTGDIEAAGDCFRFGKEKASGSLWSLYCGDALENLF